MSGEVIAFNDMCDIIISISLELSHILGRKVPLQLFTNSKSIFELISKVSRTSEKHAMLDIAAAWEGFRDKLISDIVFVTSSANVGDGLKKPLRQAILENLLSNGYIEVQAEQWIVGSEGVTWLVSILLGSLKFHYLCHLELEGIRPTAHSPALSWKPN